MEAARIARAEAALGYHFRDPEILTAALTQPTYVTEHPGAVSYDRLEFLGDSVLGFVVADHMYRLFPDLPEGELTKRKHQLVSGAWLAEAGRKLAVGELVRLGVGAEASGDRTRPSLLEDVMEALIGALYLDGGLDPARDFIMAALGDSLTAEHGAITNSKGALQEWTQAHGQALPAYELLTREGPVHQAIFTVRVLIEGRPVAQGSGASIQAAEKAAAAAALDLLMREAR